MRVEYPQFGTIESRLYMRARVRSVAEELRLLAGQTGRDRFEPLAFADQLGIQLRIVPLPPGYSGRLRKERGAAVVELNAGEAPVRRRFTLCHELAHFCFWAGGEIIRDRSSFSATQTEFRLEEMLCNSIASELLMPSDRFVSYAKKDNPSYAAVRRLAQTFDVSPAAVIKKISQTPGHGWITASAAWKYDRSTGLRRYRNVRLTNRPRAFAKFALSKDMATKAFDTAESLLIRNPGMLATLRSYIELAMPAPEVTVYVSRSTAQTRSTVQGVIFFRLKTSYS